MSEKVAVLGSTGSVGRQALEVIEQLGYGVVALAAGANTALLLRQARAFAPAVVAVEDEAAGERARGELEGLAHRPKVLVGKGAAAEVARCCGAGLVLNAVVGVAGLSATLAALQAGANVALANKESLVAGGELVVRECRSRGAMLLPVDSEHSAIFQCLGGEASPKALRRIWLTASGGPFYGKTAAQLADVTPEQALRHPNWKMGRKITVDSACLMNKGLELIEAMWLFGLEADAIEVVVQRESVIHSMVEFCDSSVLAQLGCPDMRLPIRYALTWPRRVPCAAPAPDFRAISALHFGAADEDTFRCLPACRAAARKGGLAPCAACSAGEEAVELFLQGRTGFLDIGRLVEGCVNADGYAGGYSLPDVYECDAFARRYVREHIGPCHTACRGEKP